MRVRFGPEDGAAAAIAEALDYGASSGGLSKREEAVLRLLAWGYTNKEVADQLELSVKTVDSYRFRLARKLGFKNRVDMVAYAAMHHWFRHKP